MAHYCVNVCQGWLLFAGNTVTRTKLNGHLICNTPQAAWCLSAVYRIKFLPTVKSSEWLCGWENCTTSVFSDIRVTRKWATFKFWLTLQNSQSSLSYWRSHALITLLKGTPAVYLQPTVSTPIPRSPARIIASSIEKRSKAFFFVTRASLRSNETCLEQKRRFQYQTVSYYHNKRPSLLA